MQTVLVESSSQFIPWSIAVAVGILVVAFAVIRRVRWSGDNEITARRFRPRQAPWQRMALIAALVTVTTGLTLVFSGRRSSRAAASLGDSLSVASDSATSGAPLVVMIAIGLLAVVVVVLRTLRDGER